MANGNTINSENGPKYPAVKVHMMGGCVAFHQTVCAVQTAMRQAGLPLQELSSFYEDAADGDEDDLLRTCLRWVDVDVR